MTQTTPTERRRIYDGHLDRLRHREAQLCSAADSDISVFATVRRRRAIDRVRKAIRQVEAWKDQL